MTVAPRERATPPRVCCRLRGPGDCGEESWPALHPCRPQASRGTSVVWGCLETTGPGPDCRWVRGSSPAPVSLNSSIPVGVGGPGTTHSDILCLELLSQRISFVSWPRTRVGNEGGRPSDPWEWGHLANVTVTQRHQCSSDRLGVPTYKWGAAKQGTQHSGQAPRWNSGGREWG